MSKPPKRMTLTKSRYHKWIAALQSGKYKQGVGQLAYNHGDGNLYCCLGVLGRVCGISATMMRGEDMLRVDLLDSGQDEGTANGDCILLEESVQTGLANLNDKRVSFAQIAKKISTKKFRKEAGLKF